MWATIYANNYYYDYCATFGLTHVTQVAYYTMS